MPSIIHEFVTNSALSNLLTQKVLQMKRQMEAKEKGQQLPLQAPLPLQQAQQKQPGPSQQIPLMMHQQQQPPSALIISSQLIPSIGASSNQQQQQQEQQQPLSASQPVTPTSSTLSFIGNGSLICSGPLADQTDAGVSVGHTQPITSFGSTDTSGQQRSSAVTKEVPLLVSVILLKNYYLFLSLLAERLI
ncbi:unnamed protein product [Protopolystoma xenopodis]|uniref:Uncharacterized protein n=1 Tax=Protopolystoma xenopodis TaxID=117903 RepID=A0A3S5ATL1_9PLAT|nr:unnamed protein product [Protopolystoma xenopodis]